MLALAALLTFAAVFLLVTALTHLWERRAQSALQLMQARLNGARPDQTTVRLFRNDRMSALPGLHHWLSRTAFANRFRRYLEQADLAQSVGLVLGIALLLAILSAHVMWKVTSSWLLAMLGMCLFGSLPLLYVARRRRRRLTLYSQQLPEALDVLARSLKAGHSFLQGVQAVGREMPEPAATEFRMTFEALRLGRSLREALQAHANRVENLDFNLIATSLLIQREVGGNLAEVLENVSHTIRERFKLLGQIRSLSAQNWLAGKIVCALPFAIGVVIYLLRPELILVLFKEETGKNLIAIAMLMQILGFFAMRRIMTIKI
jgi:tight adherence protein B